MINTSFLFYADEGLVRESQKSKTTGWGFLNRGF